ncbi:PLP-dependent aminotransferase family protein [Apibacter raozihei]|uniref:aminotransferase-like domain-containing protein n=1 Tax=Apibacter raozihei TaxID=2500547 RepID=UPI001E421202|nr:PLP-dependent aminotransferase family protein [Apibacter raozihei]
MDSPIIISLFSQLKLDKYANTSLYIQLSDYIIDGIKQGKLLPGYKLPSTRRLSELLNINRITVSKAFQELEQQGWMESFIGKGSFISSSLPQLSNYEFSPGNSDFLKHSGFKISKNISIDSHYPVINSRLRLDDGFPDLRLSPIKELTKAYQNQSNSRKFYFQYGTYSTPSGSLILRKSLSEYLNYSRALQTTENNILTVKGTTMGIHLVCSGLLEPGDCVVMENPGWKRAEDNFKFFKAEILKVSVDTYGLSTEELENICIRKKIRLVYVTSHHQYPTTVTLRMDRRLELIRLSEKYKFILFEDDYDFDFHYKQKPLQPLASLDKHGMVIYCGSFSKILAPVFRLGYLVASENVIEHLTKIRLITDRQGDYVLENAMAELIDEGIIQRYLRKAVKIYKE